jgi:hypothetical protein
MPLTLEAGNLNIVKWWVDASFAVHPDMKAHTGGALSFGKGVIYGTSTRHKLNTRSSTESELVGLNDVMPQILWTQYFLKAQGCSNVETTVYQDNQSTMLLANNGRASSSKRTRHLDIQYFFVTDRIAAGDMKIEYCPTGNMIADFFTKPLQGLAFQTFRDFIMNVDQPCETQSDPRSVLGNEIGTVKSEPIQNGFISPVPDDVGWKRVPKTSHPHKNEKKQHFATSQIVSSEETNLKSSLEK